MTDSKKKKKGKVKAASEAEEDDDAEEEEPAEVRRRKKAEVMETVERPQKQKKAKEGQRSKGVGRAGQKHQKCNMDVLPTLEELGPNQLRIDDMACVIRSARKSPCVDYSKELPKAAVPTPKSGPYLSRCFFPKIICCLAFC